MFVRFLGPALLMLTGCATVDPAKEVRGLPPAALTVAIDDVELPTQQAPENLRFAANAVQARTMLIDNLRALDAASRVVSVSELADPNDADVVVRPSVTSAQFAHAGLSGGFWASGLLWLSTWIGGLAMADSTYDSGMATICKLGHPQRPGWTSLEFTSAPVDLSLLQRNGFFSWPTLQSLILPPFLTSDDKQPTSVAMTEKSMEGLALDVARFLKQDYEGRSLDWDACQIAVAQPKNGAVLGSGPAQLEMTVRTKVPAEQITVVVNGALEDVLAELATVHEPAKNTFTMPISTTLDTLRQGENIVRLTISAGETYSRTLRIYVGAKPAGK